MMKKLIRNIFIILILVISLSIIADHYSNVDRTGLQKAKVIQVYDGDTLQVSINNHYETVRLIGIDTPETKGKYNEKDEFYGQKSAEYLRKLLPKNTIVYLKADEENRDKYDRLLMYLWLDTDQEIFVNLILLEKGYAETMFFEPNTKYYELFKSAERKAKKNNKGMWKNK